MRRRTLVVLASLSISALPGCADQQRTRREQAVRQHETNAEEALQKGDLARAAQAADLAAAYDPLEPRLRDLALRVRLTQLARAPETVGLDRAGELDYQAETLLQRDPAHKALYLTARSYVAAARKDRDSAEKWAREALGSDAAFAPARIALAKLLVLKGERDAGVKQLEEAKDPNDPQIAATLASIYNDGAQFDRASVAAQKALEKGESSALRLQLARAEIGQQKLAEATQELTKVVQAEPQNGEAQRMLGDALLGQGQLQQAERAYAAASQLGAEPAASFGRATVFFQAKEFKQAARLYDQVTTLAPALGAAWYQAALSHEQAGEMEQAVAGYTHYVQLASREPAERLRVEDATARLGRLQKK